MRAKFLKEFPLSTVPNARGGFDEFKLLNIRERPQVGGHEHP